MPYIKKKTHKGQVLHGSWTKKSKKQASGQGSSNKTSAKVLNLDGGLHQNQAKEASYSKIYGSIALCAMLVVGFGIFVNSDLENADDLLADQSDSSASRGLASIPSLRQARFENEVLNSSYLITYDYGGKVLDIELKSDSSPIYIKSIPKFISQNRKLFPSYTKMTRSKTVMEDEDNQITTSFYYLINNEQRIELQVSVDHRQFLRSLLSQEDRR